MNIETNGSTPVFDQAGTPASWLGEQSIMSTLGGPGSTQLFFHDFTSIPEFERFRKWLPAADRYDERALVLARENDIVLTRNPIDRDYLKFLNRLGIGPDSCRVVKTVQEARNLIETHHVILNPYILTNSEIALAKQFGARIVGNAQIVRHANQKGIALEKAHELGVPIAPGEFVHNDGKRIDLLLDTIEKIRSVTGKVFVRASEGFSGSAQVVVDDVASNFAEALRLLPKESTLLVQVLLPVTISPNIQLHINAESGAITCATICDQRLDSQLAHRGNIFPSVARTLPQMLNSAYRLAQWLQKEGFNGLVGFDFCEYVDASGELRHFLAEINPRVNASAYPGALMERTGAAACLSASLPTSARTFAELSAELGDRLYDASRGSGILPYNTGSLSIGKYFFAALGTSRSEVESLYDAVATQVSPFSNS